MIILLDLNYTLVANSPKHGTTPERMEKRLAGEQYRQWLIEMLRSFEVLLVTARPEKWQDATMLRIQAQTGWIPANYFFAPNGWFNPPAIKRRLLMEEILPNYGRRQRYLAIESNPKTRAMYAEFKIPSLWVNKEGNGLRDEVGSLEHLTLTYRPRHE
jgi:hypothetical protein